MIDCSDFTLEPRLRLHAAALFEVLSEAALYEYIDEEPPDSVEALARRFAATETGRSPDGGYYWLNWVVRIASGQVAGFVQATIDPQKKTSVAYVLGKQFWGHNLGFRAVSQMLVLLARDYQVGTVRVSIEAANRRSIDLAQRLGFTPIAGRASSDEMAQGEVILEKRLERSL